MTDRAERMIVVLVSILLLLPLVGARPDDEEFANSVISSVLHARALLDGSWPFWTSWFALGLPHPFAVNFVLHPLVLLFALPFRWGVVLFYLAHVIVGALALVSVCRVVGISRGVRFVCVLTWLTAHPTLLYTLVVFWPSCLVTWTLAPVLLLCMVRLSISDGRRRALYSSLTGLTAGLIIANSHLGYVFVFVVAFGVFVVCLGRAAITRWQWWLLAGALAVLISSSLLVHVAAEAARFPPNLTRYSKNPPSLVPQLRLLFVQPWNLVEAARLLRAGQRHNEWNIFGAVFAALTAIGLVWRRREPIDRALGVTVVCCFAAMFIPKDTPGLTILSASGPFRDALVLFAIPLAGLTADRFLARARFRLATAVALALGIVQVGMGLEGVSVLWYPTARAALGLPADVSIDAYDLVRESPLIRTLQRLDRETPGRVAMTLDVDALIRTAELDPDGITFNSLAYHGVRQITGIFKGISTHNLYPDPQFPYGYVAIRAGWGSTASALDAFNVRYLVTTEPGVWMPNWSRVADVPLAKGKTVTVLANPDAWPDAVFVRPEARRLGTLDRPATCGQPAFLCANFHEPAQLRAASEGTARVEHTHGDLIVRVDPADHPRILSISEFYRDGWKADTTGAEVFPIFEQLVGVTVPAGVTSVRLSYQPVHRIVSTIASIAAVVIALVIVAYGTMSPAAPKV